jgi:hypothetical protein
MKLRRILLFVVMLLVFASMAVAVSAQKQVEDLHRDDHDSGRNLAGSWLVTATFTDPVGIPPFKVLFSFAPGKNDNEGTLIDTNEFQLTPNPVCSPDQGVWERTGSRSFIATHFNFCFDAFNMYVPAGPTKIRDTIRVSHNGESFQMRQYIEGFDTDGNLVFVGTVEGTGVRIHAEAPPAP